MVCVTYVQIEQLVPARPPKSLNEDIQTSPDGDRLPLVFLRGCFAAKNRSESDPKNLIRIKRCLSFSKAKILIVKNPEKANCIVCLGLNHIFKSIWLQK